MGGVNGVWGTSLTSRLTPRGRESVAFAEVKCEIYSLRECVLQRP